MENHNANDRPEADLGILRLSPLEASISNGLKSGCKEVISLPANSGSLFAGQFVVVCRKRANGPDGGLLFVRQVCFAFPMSLKRFPPFSCIGEPRLA